MSCSRTSRSTPSRSHSPPEEPQSARSGNSGASALNFIITGSFGINGSSTCVGSKNKPSTYAGSQRKPRTYVGSKRKTRHLCWFKHPPPCKPAPVLATKSAGQDNYIEIWSTPPPKKIHPQFECVFLRVSAVLLGVRSGPWVCCKPFLASTCGGGPGWRCFSGP